MMHQSFAKNEKNLLDCDALILDELLHGGYPAF